MAKFKKTAIIICLILLLSTVFVSCKDGNDSQDGTMTLVVGTKEYEVDLSEVEVGLLSVLAYLEKEGVTYHEDGGFLTQVGEVCQDAQNGIYLYIYTSVEEDYDVSVYATQKEYAGKTLVSSGVGAKDMHLEDGCIILIDTIQYVW